MQSDDEFQALLRNARAVGAGVPATPQIGQTQGEFDTVLQDARQRGDMALRASLDQALSVQPEKYAEQRKVAQRLGVAPAVVETLPDEMNRRDKLRNIESTMATAPVLKRKFTEADFAKLGQDDTLKLADIERAVSKAARYIVSADYGSGKGSLVEDAPGFAKDLSLGATVGVGKMIFDIAGVVTDVIGADTLAAGYRRMSKDAADSMQFFGSQPTTSTGKAVKSGLQSAGQNLALLPLGLERGLFATAEAAGTAVAGMMGAGVGAGAYNEARDAGKGKVASAVYGIPQGAFEFLFEKIPASKLFGDLANNAGLMKTLRHQALSEGWTEQATTLAQDFNEWMNMHPEKTLGDFIAARPEAAYQTLIATLIGVGVQGSTIHGINKIVEKAADQKLQFEQDNFNELMKLAAGSALRERSPEQFRSFVQAAVDNNESATKSIHVDAQVLNQLAPDVLNQLPESVRAQIPTEAAKNGTVEIPMADVLTIAPGTPLEQVLNDHARMTPDAMSRADAVAAGDQAQVLRQEAERVMAQANDQQAARAEYDTVQQMYAKQLTDSGRYRPQVADAMGHWLASFYTAYGSRDGMTATQMRARYPVNIVGKSTGGGQVMDQPGTPNFDNWFGDSKVVDENGRPLVVYHGSTRGGISRATVQNSFFTSSRDVARTYSEDDYAGAKGEAPVVQEVYLRISNPLVVDAAGEDWMRVQFEGKRYTTDDLAREAGRRGHDGLVVKNVVDNVSDEDLPPADVYVTLGKAGQIKSAVGNDGTFDANDPSILSQEQQTPRGTFNPATLELVLNPNANLSTFFHETGHFFLEVMANIASRPDAPAQIAADMNTFLKWAGISDLQTWNALDLDGKRKYHERWAESIEQYVMEGKAPSVELQPLMRRFAAWLKSVYGSIQKFLAARGQTPAAGGEALNQSNATRLYHGSKQPIEGRFRASSKSINTTTFGDVATERTGVFFSDNPEFSAEYGAVAPYDVNIESTAEVTRDLILDFAETIDPFGPERELHVLVKNTKSWGMFEGEVGRRFVAYLQEQGYDSATFQEDLETEDGGNVESNTTVVFDPARISPAGTLAQDGPRQSGPQMALNDDIRRVMDRMLATDEQIAQANEVAGLVPDLEADAEAAERLNKRSMADLKWAVRARDQVIAKLQKQAKAIEKDLREQVTVEVDQTPEMRAKRALDALAVSPEYAGILTEHKVNRKTAEAQVAAEVKAALLAEHPEVTGLFKGQLLAKNKRDLANKVEAAMIKWDSANPAPKRPVNATDADVATIADSFGFESVDAMLQAIDAFGSRADAIDGLTQQRMLQDHGDLIDERAIREAANEAVHNEARARSLATELRTQREMLGTRTDTGEVNAKGSKITVNALVEAAKQFAANVVARTPLRDLPSKAWQHTAAERRAGKRWQEATAAGKTQEAVQAKQDQVLNNAAAKAALEAKDQAAKWQEYLKKFDKDTVREKINVDYLDQIDKLLERVDLRKIGNTDSRKRAKLAEWIQLQSDMGLEVELPAAVMEDAALKPYADMNYTEAEGLVETVKQIEHLGRLKERLLTAKDKREFGAVKTEMVESIRQYSKGRTAESRTAATPGGRWLQKIRNFGYAHIKAATVARILDGDREGVVWNYLIRPANVAGDLEVEMRASATQELTKILAPFLTGVSMTKAKHYAVVNRSLTREQILAIALNTGNASNQQRLMGGEGWTPDQVQSLLDTLSPEEANAVQQVWDFYENLRPQVAELERDMFGKEPNWIDPTPVVIGGVQLRGGYYPVVYDAMASIKAEQHADAEQAKRQIQNSYSAATVRKGFTKGRAEEVVGRPLLYSLSGIYRGVNDVVHYIAWQRWLVDANRLLGNKAIDSEIRNTYGPEMARQLKSWRDAVAEGDSSFYNEGDKLVGALRMSISVAGLGYNVMSALLQPLGFTQSVSRIGKAWVGKGLKHTIANPSQAAKDAAQMSTFMRNRVRTRFRELNEIRNRIDGQSTPKRLMMEHSFWLMMRMQHLVDLPTWWGAYEKAISEGSDDEKAVAQADQAVIDSQGGGQTKDLSAIERGGPGLKLFTVFYSFMNTQLQLLTNSAMTRSKARMAADVLLLSTIPALLQPLLKNLFTPGDSGDEDKDWLALVKKAIAAQLNGFLGLFVVGREFADVGKIFLEDGRPQDYAGPAGVRVIGDTVKAGTQIKQGEFDDALRKALVNLIGDVTGFPAAQVNRTVTGVKALSEGKTSNPAALLMGYQEPH